LLIKHPGFRKVHMSGARLPTLQLTTSHSQRLNSEKPLGTGCCKWLWSIATWANGTLPNTLSIVPIARLVHSTMLLTWWERYDI